MSLLDGAAKLRRFCFLGSLEPVYVYHAQTAVNLELHWQTLQGICSDVDGAAIVALLKEVLPKCKLVRRDEPLFVYATYLSSSVDVGRKTAARQAFPALVTNDEDLFLFCKYAFLIRKAQKKKGISQTIRKAIISWYELQSPAALRDMWLSRRGAHGFTHKGLIRLCRVTDTVIGEVGAISPFFKTCTELLKESESTDPTTQTPPVKQASETETTATTAVPIKASAASGDAQELKPNALEVDAEKASSTTEVAPSIVTSMSKLRTTKNKAEALKIVRKFKLHYTQVPRHFLRYPSIVEALIPSMSYMQLLTAWRNLARFNHFQNPKLFKLCKTTLDNKRMLHKENIHPIVFLMKMYELGLRGGMLKMAHKKAELLKMSYFNHLYAQSFGTNPCTGLRVHITINLQANYKKKYLRNHKKLTYYEAVVALAFAYFKNESNVDVFHWVADSGKLQQIPWVKTMTIADAMQCCDAIENQKNTQRLVLPLMQSMRSDKVYDLYMAIVPTAGRGNPAHSSDLLCKFLDKYRELKKTTTKYVIVNLLKFRKSMYYSSVRNENILEICGLEDNTTNLINYFALNYFG